MTAEPIGGVDLFYEAMAEVFPVQAAEPFVAPPVVPVEARDEAYRSRAAGWCAKALTGRAETLAAMLPDTGRNDYLSKSAWVLYRFCLAGHLDADQVTNALRIAAVDSGLGVGETEATLASAHRGAVRDGPLEPPLGEREADPFDGLVVDPVTGEVGRQMTVEELLEQQHQRKVAEELRLLRARDEAKRLYTAERAALEFREPPSVLTLREQLLLPRDEVTFSIESLLPAGGNALLTAQYKSGKTTLVANLLRAYADEQPFLGRFKVNPGAGRIAIFNYELSPAQFDTWLEQAGIVHQERVSVLHLRGYRLPLTVPRVEDWIVDWLRDHDVSFWVADPFARAAVGTDENSNTEVGIWLDTFDVIKERAGVSEGVLPVHTGRAEQESGTERARGATRLDDWADVRWILTKDKQDTRFFRATGRDVELAEEKLTYDEATRAYRIGGGDRRWEERRAKAQAVLDFINANPGCSGRQIQLAVGGNKDSNAEIRGDLLRRHKIRVEIGTAKQGEMHYGNTTEA